ncbi:hypothetical protein F511_19353 [Dorcoceras hygrometricum]|uniref:RING-type domain-containing protein n=1 Tax=Dorcoceras hygrometricum TaxID=472368 RepID=A0A2Z7CBS1_9LAMI|nr:hypothetical protein F511_19353 [Dorcoceras hygrometricum]
MWSSAASTRLNCGLPPEFFFVAPASSFQHHNPDAAAAAAATTINFDPHSFNGSNAIGVGVGVGVIPLLTATPCLAQQNIGSGGSTDDDVLNIARSRSSGGMQLWQHQQSQNSSGYTSKKPMILDHTSLLQSGTGGSTGCGIGGSSSMGATTCQDCGNQAKKDCIHRRCRTCCKSRGYDCVTHVRSTWVSASRRRERQVARENIPAAGSSQSTSGAKKPRLAGTSQTTTTASHTSTSNTTPPRSFDTSSSHQDSLPGQVRAPAVFKCVRVTALDDGEDEYAYQAVTGSCTEAEIDLVLCETNSMDRCYHNGDCSICLNNIVLQETALVKGCEHAYCVTCILRWASYKKEPTCPQCKIPFEFLNIHRKLDGSINDFMFEESVCLLLRAPWFNPLVVLEREEVDDEIDDYYYEDEEEDLDDVYFSSSSSLRIGNRRWGDNGFVRSGRQEARPVYHPNVDNAGAGSSRQPKKKEKKETAPKEIVGRRAKRALKRESADKAAAEKHQQHLIRLGRK